MPGVVQLIINGTTYPSVSTDNYRAYPQDLGKTMRMISGRMVKEIRGRFWIIEYTRGIFTDSLLRTCLQDLRSDKPLLVDFLVPESEERLTSQFLCVKEPNPVFAFSDGGRARWHNINFTLEEIDTWHS